MSFEILSMPAPLWASIIAIALFAGCVKGIVGFAMPMILISGLGSLLAPQDALAALILPTLVTNVMQAARYGLWAAVQSVRRFGLFLGVGLVMLLLTAQLVPYMDPTVFYLVLGGPVVIYALLSLLGVPMVFRGRNRVAEGVFGAITGAIGGLSGVWGPPTVAYLTSFNLAKVEQMRVQGAIYGLGAIALFVAHTCSGVFTVERAPLSVAMIVPSVIGLWVGFRIQDRIDQATFKKVTLWVLLFAGLNLIRRALMG